MTQVLLHVSQNVDASRGEIEAYQGRVVHRLSDDVIVAALPEGFDIKKLTKSVPVSEGTRLAAASGDLAGMQRTMRTRSFDPAARMADKVDESTRAAIAAWHYQMTEGKKVNPKDGLAWDSPEHEAP